MKKKLSMETSGFNLDYIIDGDDCYFTKKIFMIKILWTKVDGIEYFCFKKFMETAGCQLKIIFTQLKICFDVCDEK